MRYNYFIIDVMNLAYRTFDHKSDVASYVSKKQVYKNAICNFIKKVEELENSWLHSDGKVILLFDNPTSRIDLQSSFYFADRKLAYAKYKQDRKKETKEFYNSIGLLKYYYMVNTSKYMTIQLPRVEADDLVKPVLEKYCKNSAVLLVTNDLDWTRYLNSDVHWLPKAEIETAEELSEKLEFPVTENSIIMYKALFGDPSDNIPSIAPESQRFYFKEMLELKADNLPTLAYSNSNIEKYPLLKHVRAQEKQYRINLQLVNIINVSEKHLDAVTTVGRNSSVGLQALREVLGLSPKKSSFVFGNIKRPRV